MHSLPLHIASLCLILCSTVAAAESERLEDGRMAYEYLCAECHDSGKMGAPVSGQSGDWSGRSPLWEAVLFEHAEKGYMKMPARGGTEDASEYDVQAASEYLLTISHPELPGD